MEVRAIVAYSKGFACSGEAGTVWLFEKTGEKDFYAKTRLIKVGMCRLIRNMAHIIRYISSMRTAVVAVEHCGTKAIKIRVGIKKL